MKTINLIFMILVVQRFSFAMPVLDPTNLAQNIIQVAQQRLTAKLNGDTKEINKTQLKADNQTVADVIGMNSTEKTNLNLDLAEFNYNNNPSVLIKNYYERDLKVRDRINNVGKHLNNVKSFYVNQVMSLLNKLDNEMVTRTFTGFSTQYGLMAKKYDPFINTAGKTSKNIDLGNLFEKFENNGQTTTNEQNIDLKPLENQYKADMKKVEAEQKELAAIQSAIGGMKGPNRESIAVGMMHQFLMKYGHFQEAQKLLFEAEIGGKNFNVSQALDGIGGGISDKIGNITQGYQEQIESLAGSALGGLGGEMFGGSATEKGKGKEIKIDAPMGVISDVERIKLINESITAYSDLDKRITMLHEKLIAIKSGYENKEFKESNLLDINKLLKKGGAMDYSKMSNFDKKQ